jgi:hypothetical protein
LSKSDDREQYAAKHRLFSVIGASVTALANYDATIIRAFALLGLVV